MSCINSYLVDAPAVFIENRTKPLCEVAEMVYGSKPTDGGGLILNNAERDELLLHSPTAAKWVRPFMGADEFINGYTRWCLWLKGVNPAEMKQCPAVMERIERVRAFRLRSTKAKTREDAATPYLFQEIRQPESGMFIVIPRHSSENRIYLPIGFVSSHTIAGDSNQMVPNATLYHFGVLTSTMHMAWMRTVAGRLKSDYRYSGKIVYNNFPWPEVTEEQQEKIAALAQAVLDARALYPDSSLAALYDPLTMPPELVRAHQKLDAAVEKAYGQRFATDAERVAHLFALYEQMT